MRLISNKQATMLGSLTLAALALFCIGLFSIGARGSLGANPLQFTALFPEIRGVETGTRVRLLGMDAGEVSKIIPPTAPGGQVGMELLVQRKYQGLIRQDASVAIHSEGMLGVKVLEIQPGTAGAPALETLGILATRPSPDLSDILKQASETIASIRQGDGSLGKLTRDPKLYDALLQLAQQSSQTMQSFQQDADALKKMPIVRSYIEDPLELLVRPNCERKRKTLESAALFDPASAVLTARGKTTLNELVPWILEFPKDADMAIASFTQNGTNDNETSKLLSRQQSDAVVDYLRNQHSIHKSGWFSRRKISSLGLGSREVPTLECPPGAKPARVEVLLFLQRG